MSYLYGLLRWNNFVLILHRGTFHMHFQVKTTNFNVPQLYIVC